MKLIPLIGRRGLGKFAMVDDEDFDFINQFRWYLDKSGYAKRKVKKGGKGGRDTSMFMHRLIANTPKGMFTDHINMNTLDDRKENLRVCTRSQNSMNRKAPKHNTTGHKGVNFYKRYNCYCVRITANKKRHLIGYFKRFRTACLAFRRAARYHHGEFANY